MTSIVTSHHNTSQPARSKSAKSEITDNVARAIIRGEAETREAKTRRLRNARLAMEVRLAQAKSSKPHGETAPKKKSRPAAKATAGN